MPVLTPEELVSLNPDSIYNIKPFVLHYELWSNIRPDLSVLFRNPICCKFDENIRNLLPQTKGIYIFCVEPDFPFQPLIRCLMYVGKVTGDNHFKKRFYEYVNAIGEMDKRRNIQLLTNLWPDKTWVYIYDLNHLTDDEIVNIEDNLLDNIVPPMNNKFKAKRALNSRSLYQ